MEKRPKKFEKRQYFALVLSDMLLEDRLDYPCWNCRKTVVTAYHQPKAGLNFRLAISDAEGVKVTESLCRKCNIMYQII